MKGRHLSPSAPSLRQNCTADKLVELALIRREFVRRATLGVIDLAEAFQMGEADIVRRTVTSKVNDRPVLTSHTSSMGHPGRSCLGGGKSWWRQPSRRCCELPANTPCLPRRSQPWPAPAARPVLAHRASPPALRASPCETSNAGSSSIPTPSRKLRPQGITRAPRSRSLKRPLKRSHRSASTGSLSQQAQAISL
ncbi:hypothetical protein ACVIYL_009048 [Bradyrhizobium sp. USDA 3315]